MGKLWGVQSCHTSWVAPTDSPGMIWGGRQTSARPDARKGKAFRWISVQDVVLARPSRTAKEGSKVEPPRASCSFAVNVEQRNCKTTSALTRAEAKISVVQWSWPFRKTWNQLVDWQWGQLFVGSSCAISKEWELQEMWNWGWRNHYVNV